MAPVKVILRVLFGAPSVVALHGDLPLNSLLDLAGPRKDGGPVRQALENDHDMLYTLHIKLGGQDVRAIPDSGSFEFLAFSKECKICGLKNGYDSSKSPTFSSTDFENEQDFGSGSARSVESFDKMTVGSAIIENQTFWKVTEADAGFADISFGGILGIGPPGSAVVVAEQSANEAEKEVQKLKRQGEDVSGLWPLVEQLRLAVMHAKSHVQFIQSARIESYSICFRPGNGQPGELIWNDNAAYEHQELFTTVSPVQSVNTIYWSAVLTEATLAGDRSFLGCKERKCDGVVDTGTSLLVMPSGVYESLASRLDDLMQKDPTCGDLSSLPNLEFKLDGKQFSLPPQAFVGDITGELPSFMRAHMPHVWHRQVKDHAGSNETSARHSVLSCSLLAMQMDESSDVGPLWILGIPFFKKYYSNFQLSQDRMQPHSMHFAEKTEECLPIAGEALTLEPARIPSGMTIDASKLRAPRRPLNSFAPAVRKNIARWLSEGKNIV